MNIPEYVTREEVGRVCKALKIRDWSSMEQPRIVAGEAKKILKAVNIEKMKIDLNTFMEGLEVELEHGTQFKDANVTNNHPILTGKIVIAHLKETMDYYKRLDVAEIEGDIFKAVVQKKIEKLPGLYQKLATAKAGLYQAEVKSL
jgi:hypothetical protein